MNGYEILALFMRYVFVLLGTLILLRSFLWLRKDARAYRKELKNLPDAGLVGEMVNLDTGESYPLPREGTIGTSRFCDIHIRDRQAGRRHAAFLFTEGKGLAVTPIARRSVAMDGEQIEGKGYALHGTRLEIGNTLLRVRLFAGLNIPRRVVYAQDEEERMEQQDADLGYEDPFLSAPQVLENPWTEEEIPETISETAWQTPQDQFSQDSDMDMTWKYAPFPPEMAAEKAAPFQDETADEEENEEEEDDDSYTPPFEQVRGRRHGR